MDTENDPRLIAYCGLYCAACGSYRKKRCPGCKDNKKASWCTVRVCCDERKLLNCAGCGEYANVADCRKLNHIISKVIGFFTNSSRVRSVKKLQELGPDGYARFMSERNLQSIKKNMP